VWFRTVSTSTTRFKSANFESVTGMVTGILGRAFKTARVCSRFECTYCVVVLTRLCPASSATPTLVRSTHRAESHAATTGNLFTSLPQPLETAACPPFATECGDLPAVSGQGLGRDSR